MNNIDAESLEMAALLLLKGQWWEILFYKRLKNPFILERALSKWKAIL
jgi:hypothetical protein